VLPLAVWLAITAARFAPIASFRMSLLLVVIVVVVSDRSDSLNTVLFDCFDHCHWFVGLWVASVHISIQSCLLPSCFGPIAVCLTVPVSPHVRSESAIAASA